MSFDDELQSLLDGLSISVLSRDPLATKARRFVLYHFEGRGTIPTQEWFNEHIPMDDPYGTTYYSLLDLRGRSRTYPGCANHQLSLVHPANCQVCEVCKRSDRLTRLLTADSQFKAWNGLYGEEALLEGGDIEEQESVPVACQEALREVRQEVDAPEPYPRLRHLPVEYDSSEWDLDPSRM
ncbi:hypothetical protein FA13DRAFT_1739177 [Coprinellus micaceus]|uniref:Uncharacterized protein n=1 Tax=Coprinellus micaceus TaxID=71717 RepID=A0A4Y7SRJ3_COPMI|nr:hypothetical protein FA13DRAFT_1739177 [Coprinellus micaceus]